MRALAFRHVLDHSASCLAAAHAPLPPPDEDEDEDDDASEASSQAPSVDGLVRLAEEDPLEDLCAGKFFFQWQIAGFVAIGRPFSIFSSLASSADMPELAAALIRALVLEKEALLASRRRAKDKA